MAALRANWKKTLPRIKKTVFIHKMLGSGRGFQSPKSMRWKYALTKSENNELATARKTIKPIFAGGIEYAPPA